MPSSPPSPPPRNKAVPRWIDAAVLLVLGAILALLSAAGRVPTGDGPHLAAMTMELADGLRAGDVGAALHTWATRVTPQPPLGYLPGVAASLLVGDRWLAMLLAGAFALWLCWDALKRLADGVPWAPALVLVASPLVWLYVEQYGWDLLTAAATLQAVSWLHRSRGLRDPRAAVAFGLWMGAGFLTKYTFPMFLWLPCLWAGLGILRGPDRGARLRVLGRALLAFAALVGPWLALNGPALAAYLDRSVGTGAVAAVEASRAGANRFSADSLSLYPLALKDALGWPGLVVLGAVGMAGFFFSWGGGGSPRNAPPVAQGSPAAARPVPASGPGALLPLLAALGGLAVLSTLEQSQDRYALPALVALAALALPIARLPWGQEIFVGVFGVQLVGTIATFRPGAPTYDPRFDHGLASAAEMSWPVTRSYLPTSVDLAAWRVDEALTRLSNFASGAPAALVLPDEPWLPEPGIYLLRARQLALPVELRVLRPRGASPPREGWPGPEVRAAYVVWTPGRDVATEAWMAGQARAPLAELDLPGSTSGVVLR